MEIMRVLLTGFEPFGGYSENVSWVVAKKVATLGILDVEVITEQIPVSFARAGVALRKAVERHTPNCIIMLGQAGNSDHIRLERVALNLKDAKLADNDGVVADEETIYADSPAALFTSMPIKALCKAIEEQGVAVKISNSCGLYVCNRLYYEALTICRETTTMQALFVHLPLYDGQASPNIDKPTMPLDSMVKAIKTIIEETNDKSRKIQEAVGEGIR